MKMNFFEWIRQGVRQSVLLGISDAAEAIAPPEEAEAVRRQFLNSAGEGRLIEQAEGSAGSGKGRAKRKTLGRSLSQIMEDKK